MSLPSRRAFLSALAISPVSVAGIGAFSAASRAAAQSAGLISPNVCMVMPEVTEGPYYFDPALDRSDITEGREGVPLQMQLQVVTADCSPVPGARVDIWHCDARGIYSGYQNMGTAEDTTGETFLRGTQVTGSDGVATFATIYPGWYRGRTTHIHYKVFLDEATVLTSQIFFPDVLSEYLFRNVPPYNERGATRDTMNGNDGIAKQAGDGAYAMIREQPARYEAALVVGIDPSARSTQAMQGGPAGGPPPGGGQPPQGGPTAIEGGATPFIPGSES